MLALGGGSEQQEALQHNSRGWRVWWVDGVVGGGGNYVGRRCCSCG
jgi:hypothetical protein